MARLDEIPKALIKFKGVTDRVRTFESSASAMSSTPTSRRRRRKTIRRIRTKITRPRSYERRARTMRKFSSEDIDSRFIKEAFVFKPLIKGLKNYGKSLHDGYRGAKRIGINAKKIPKKIKVNYTKEITPKIKPLKAVNANKTVVPKISTTDKFKGGIAAFRKTPIKKTLSTNLGKKQVAGLQKIKTLGATVGAVGVGTALGNKTYDMQKQQNNAMRSHYRTLNRY